LPWLAKGAAALHLLGLTAIVTMAGHAPSELGSGSALPGLHIAFVMATGVATALLALGSTQAAPVVSDKGGENTGVDNLLTQMSHELRTPLNAVIGFSDVMLRELHGPLGNARYQEYAAHISASGGQLLKASEDTLAVTATMSALMSNRRALKRERMLASTLVRDAWETAAAAAAARNIQLIVTNCNQCTIECERRGTTQALAHILREAIANAPDAGVVRVKGRRRGGARSIEIEVGNPSAGAVDAIQVNAAEGAYTTGRGLRMILAAMLLEMQSATLRQAEQDGAWSARVHFPGNA
jgi:two-component system cell cycle sensor histidine kinase PleC